MNRDWDKVLKWLSTLSDKQYAAYLKELELFVEPEIPRFNFQPEHVDYSTRGPNDYILSGPCGRNTKGPGRYFKSPRKALEWAQEKFGKDRVQEVKRPSFQECLRWALLIKNV